MDREDAADGQLTIAGLLRRQAAVRPAAPAIIGEGAAPLTYARLWRQVGDVVAALRDLGVGPADRVALALSNGPDMAVALAAVPCAATCIPLNPDFTLSEWRRYLADLEANALLAQAGEAPAARAAAAELGLTVIELQPGGGAAAGLFRLTGAPLAGALGATPGDHPDAPAFVLPTSGTTAQPKPVPLSHRNLRVSAENTAAWLQLSARDRLLGVLPLFHAHGLISGLYTSLAAGASVVCTAGFAAPRFLAWLRDWQPTWYTAVPTVHQAVLQRVALEGGVASHNLRLIRSASASLPGPVLRELERIFAVPVIETYGMTEATPQIASNPLPSRPRKPGSVGLAAGPEVAAMDSEGRLLPAGARGELVLRGDSVFAGYGGDAAVAAEAFRDGWFRTGDLGYLDDEGYIFIVGRLKEMINRGGQSIAPREIEEMLGEHPAVQEVAAFAMPDARLGEAVAAAVVPRDGAAMAADDLRRFAAERLAVFKVPQRIHLVEAIPKGPTGKLSRSLLSAAFATDAPAAAATAVAPETPAAERPATRLETDLLAIWRDLLALDEIGLDDDFFALGGDSLLAARLLARVRARLGRALSHLDVFDAPSVRGLALRLAQADDLGAAEAIAPVSRAAPSPLSYLQQRLYFLQCRNPGSHAYHLIDLLHLEGALDPAVVVETLAALVARHEALRTRFVEVEGRPLQVVGPAFRPDLPLEELDDGPLAACRAQVEAAARREIARPFDLERGPLLRARLLRLGRREHVLLLTQYHIVTDGWSQRLFWREFGEIYGALVERREPRLPPLALDFPDLAAWQTRRVASGDCDAHLGRWRAELRNPPLLDLPLDKPRPPAWSFRGGRCSLQLSPDLVRRLRAVGARSGATLYMLVLAAWGLLLQRHARSDDLVVGTLLAGRERVESEAVIGFFVNTVALRLDLGGDPSVAELVRRIRHLALDACHRQQVPYELVLQGLKLPRHADRNPLFQVLFAWNNTPASSPDLPGLRTALLDLDPGSARFDLSLDMVEDGDEVRGFLEYASDLFDERSVARLADHLGQLLEAIATDDAQRISAIELAPAAVLQGVPRSYPADSIHGRFAAQAAATPAAVALRGADGEVSFGRLEADANRLARHLRGLGVGPGEPVGLCLARGPEMVTALLAILKAGAVVLPLDPDHPAARIAFVLADAGAALALTTRDLAARIEFGDTRPLCLDEARPAIDRQSDAPLPAEAQDDLSILLYTSGSTGRPKGVPGSHRGMMNLLHWVWETLPFGPDEAACLTTSIGFVDAQLELLAPLLAGRPVTLIPHETVAGPDRLVAGLTAARVGRIVLVPTLLSAILDACDAADAALPDLKLWVTSGEPLSRALATRFFDRFPGRRLVNLYGASETSAVVTWDEVDPREAAPQPPVGRPIANITARVVDAALRPLPPGQPGELCVSGPGVSGGYWRRDALSAERFLAAVPGTAGETLFRTGDLARQLNDGRLVLLGRLDAQVKIRGCRVEPGEVEAALAEHPAVRRVAVVADGTPGGTQRLLAYLTTTPDGGATPAELRRWARRRLPDVMLPARFVVLDRLPLTSSGKLDRRGLPAPPAPEAAAAEDAALTPTQALLAEIWRELLELDQVGAEDDFFALGGHSLLAGRMLSRIARRMQVSLSLGSVFHRATLAGLAAEIDRRCDAPAVPALPPIVAAGEDAPLPPSPAQEIMLAVEQRLPGLPFYLMPYGFRLRGSLDVVALRRALASLIRRHAALRTLFEEADDTVRQRVGETWDDPLTVETIEAAPTARAEQLQARAKAAAWQPLALDRAPLLRARLLRLGEAEHVLLVTLHHLVCDGWSWGLLLRDLSRLYREHCAGAEAAAPPAGADFPDVLRWQAALPDAAEGRRQLVHWRRVLVPPPPPLRLQPPRPEREEGGLVAARLPVDVAPDTAEAMAALSRRAGASLFMTLLAAFKLFLAERSGARDLCVASLFANRRLRDAEDVVGLLVNTVLLRSDLEGVDDFLGLLARVRRTVLAAHDNQELPFEVIRQRLEQDEGIDGGDLCRVMFVLQEAAQATLDLPGVAVSGLDADDRMGLPDLALTGFDLVVLLKPGDGGLVGNCLYRIGRFERDEAEALFDGYRRVLDRLAADPDGPLETLTDHREPMSASDRVVAGHGLD